MYIFNHVFMYIYMNKRIICIDIYIYILSQGHTCMWSNHLHLLNHVFAQELGDAKKRGKKSQGHGGFWAFATHRMQPPGLKFIDCLAQLSILRA